MSAFVHAGRELTYAVSGFPPHIKAANGLWDAFDKKPSTVRGALSYFYNSAVRLRQQPDHGHNIVSDVVEVTSKNIFERFIALGPDQAQFNEMTRALKVLHDVAQDLEANHRQRKAEGYTPEYHNDDHGPSVMANHIMLTLRENIGQEWTPEKLINLVYEAAIALNHDNRHDGTTNRIRKSGDGYVSEDYNPGRLELVANDRLQIILANNGVSDTRRDFAKWMTYSTDPELPGDILTYVYAKNFDPAICVKDEDKIVAAIEKCTDEQKKDLYEFWNALDNDEALTKAAMKLKGADMAISYGLSIPLWKEATTDFHKETQRHSPEKTLVDKDGNPIAGGQRYVMTTFVGAVVNAVGEVVPRFIYPAANDVFGKKLNEINEISIGQIPKENLVKSNVIYLQDRRPYNSKPHRYYADVRTELRAATVVNG